MLHLMLHHILTSNFTRDEKDTPPPHAPARGALNVLSAVIVRVMITISASYRILLTF